MKPLRLTDGKSLDSAELTFRGDTRKSYASIYLSQLKRSGYTFQPTSKHLRKIAAWCNSAADEMEQSK